MAKRKVQRRARKILGEDPVALVWCEIHRPIPQPPKDIHRAAGSGRLRSRHHWLWYIGAVLFCVVVVPVILIDRLGRHVDRWLWGRGRGAQAGEQRTPSDPQRSGRRRSRESEREHDPTDDVFDGDWDLTAGQLLLRWYGYSPNPQRLIMPTRDRICVAASLAVGCHQPRPTIFRWSQSSPSTKSGSRVTLASRAVSPRSGSSLPTVPGWS